MERSALVGNELDPTSGVVIAAKDTRVTEADLAVLRYLAGN